MSDVINQETAIASAVASITEAPAKVAKARKPKAPKVVDAKAPADATLAWMAADAKAMVSQGVAVACMARAMKALGRTHEEVNGEWKPTKAFVSFRTDYLMRLEKAAGENGKDKGGVIIRFALRALRVNLTPDALEKTTGKVQAVLETKEEAWKKAGRTKTDHSLGGPQGKGGRPTGGEGAGAVGLAVKYLTDKLTPSEAIAAIVQWAKAAKKVEALKAAIEK